MAKIDVIWTKTSYPISINEYATQLGFNLRTLDFEGIQADKWDWIDTRIRNKIMSYLDECWEYERDYPLSDVSQGVYVITLSGSLSIAYGNEYKPSKVLYIGRGQIRNRIFTHFKNWVRYLSDSLQDITLDIWMTEIKVNGSKDAYKEVEADLLAYFKEKFGEYPLENKKSGDNNQKRHDYCSEWNKPLHNPSNIQNGWAIKPLKNNRWFNEPE